jgi:hypothetical protein
MTSSWIELDGLHVWEEGRGLEYWLELEIIPDESWKDINSIKLTPEDAFILANSLLGWVDHIKEKGWSDSVEIVFEMGKKPYVKKIGGKNA